MNNRKSILILMLLLVIISSFPMLALADAGPKPSLEIIVKGMDNDNYWLDLLVTDESEYSWLELSDQERERVKKLAEYEDKEGFHPALLVGTQVPLFGELKGQKNPDNTYSHEFSYVGTPENFKIAILTEENTLIISDLIHRKHFNSRVDFDLSDTNLEGDIVSSAGVVKEIIPIKKMSFAFISRLLLTLAIEIGIALLFGFSIKNSGKILLKTNILTQVLLNIAVLGMNLAYGIFAALFIFLLMEMFIIIFETIIYAKHLTEKAKGRRIVYGIVANIASLIAGFGINLIM